ncbi:aldehyde dehydrogenase (NADP(+)) [Amycolatopsis acidiphila]|uniref:Aldehyde dehydrogenase (NADP(+)) n=1 Tax=Amycolatopsis acidiphila TaxID=715473 RepID=A0A558A4S4_9PSEU|nr:aldehyde dehydrogenase (NADP(+)) [Amycolatopsis acidiphila]TVT19257.1 aldehyde dehydrogenase (NADP(+)) [Amycolatopsis acidiphila]UIJ62317.1 aldehyde dehydrogenase (NADP(+)) [Amycolatopsis acidiphila]GHG96841.1 aldehyde dehydrogenase [Amycolatopsis acidiphila]
MDTETTELDRILAAAAKAAPQLAGTTPAQRAGWLAAAADALDAAADELVPLAAKETHLAAAPRLKGELARTTFQLRLFGEVLRDGAFLGAAVDHADPEWPMGPRPDIRRAVVPMGPVLVFAASNFPFAFSVAGGDTASALAAGCPVVLKAHPGHPELSVRTGQIVRDALVGAGAPAGIFEVIFGVETGVTALKDPRISAAAFTGSVPGGRALFDIAVSRPSPIPFYGELGSVNPVVVTPGAVKARGEQVAKGYVGSFTLGAGQFCTKPGLLFLPEGHGLDATLSEAAQAVGAQTMLNERIGEGFQAGAARLRELPDVTVLASGDPFTPTLLSVSAADFLKADEVLRSECFGPASIVVTYRGQDELLEVLGELEPGLTATVQAEETEAEDVRPLLPALTRIAGRLLWNDWPTGVTVSWAQQHGGPYPATTAPTTTSVGTAAIERFLRPVAWQGFPDTLLPPALQEANPWDVPRRVDGVR